MDEIKQVTDNEIITPLIIYWEKVKQKLENYKK
jgi:hypothetical protein